MATCAGISFTKNKNEENTLYPDNDHHATATARTESGGGHQCADGPDDDTQSWD